jgi:hypothetical protein
MLAVRQERGVISRKDVVAKIPVPNASGDPYHEDSSTTQESLMSKSTDHIAAPPLSQPSDQNHKADQANPNCGTPGTNKAYDHVHGNRGGQLNPNRRPG